MSDSHLKPTGLTHYLQYEVFPTEQHPDFGVIGGAYVNCWVIGKSTSNVQTIAEKELTENMWIVGNLEAASEPKRENLSEDALEYFDQAQLDGKVFDFHTFPIEDVDQE